MILLTETSAGPGTAWLLEQLRRAGYAVVNTPDEVDRGAALISRVPATAHEPDVFGEVSIPARVAAREQALTDHAAVELLLDVEAARLPCDGLAGAQALSLF
ncbi:hypothetical protein ACWCOT_45880 [Nonomuraea bangladeshensis]